LSRRQRSEWRKIILPLINYNHLRYRTSVQRGKPNFSGEENDEKSLLRRNLFGGEP
jgi:hypothetical protein